jgi:protein involved in polysaccharide export with SLBB domain
VIVIDVEGEYTTRSVIDSSGDINLVYISKLHVAGLTLQQATLAIKNAYVPKYYSYMYVFIRRC